MITMITLLVNALSCDNEDVAETLHHWWFNWKDFWFGTKLSSNLKVVVIREELVGQIERSISVYIWDALAKKDIPR